MPLHLQRLVLVAINTVLALVFLTGCGADGDGPEPVWTVRTGASEVPASTRVVAPATEQALELATPQPTAAPTSPTATATITPPAPLAAVVNGQYVFLADYQQRVDQYELALLEQGLDPDTREGQAQLAQMAEDVLEGLIDFALIEQSADDLGVLVSDGEIAAQIEADVAAGGGEAAFAEWLKATGTTRDDYRELLRSSLLSQRVLDVVTADVPETAEQVHAWHIAVATEEEADEIVGLLNDGADFTELARERSIEVATSDDGGDLGWFPRGLVAPDIEITAFSLSPGDFSEVFYLANMYHIILVTERDENRKLSADALIDLKLSVFERWLDGRRVDARIERLVSP